MRSKLIILIIGLCLGLAVQAETTITYQGQLQDSGGPVTDTLEMVFRLFDDATGTNQIGSDIVDPEVSVTDGLFQVELDFGDVYSGERWLEVEVAGTILEPRQPITPTPLAVRAFNVPASSLEGDFWRQGGNVGTDPANDFLGTTDDMPFEVHVASERALRIEPAEIPNIIGGWAGNTVDTDVAGATIGGGGCPDLGTNACFANLPNEVTSDFGTIGGGVGNAVTGQRATVGGGSENTASDRRATIGGGWSNTASGRATTVGGGDNNTASGRSATVGGGEFNTASAWRGTVGGGMANTSSVRGATVGGGEFNTASGVHATVGGGQSNTASGSSSTVPGGQTNTALGEYSFAAGRRAKAEHDGVFVWADATDLDFASTNADQFLIRAGGGVGINTNDPAGFNLAVNGDASVGTLQLNSLIGTGSETLCRGTNNFVSECTSSGNYKEEVSTVEQGESRILRLNPVHFSWTETGAEDMGLIAEEVAEVEPRLVNRDESGTVTGVRYRHLTALLISAVQEQAEAMESDRQRLAALEAENAELRQLAERNAELEERLAALESLLLDDRAVAAGQ